MADPVPAKEAAELIRKRKAPADMVVNGTVDFSKSRAKLRLPEGLRAARINLTNCRKIEALPKGLRVRHLNISGCTALTSLPASLECYQLSAGGAGLRGLPDDIRVAYKIDLAECVDLETLPANLRTGTLVLNGCTALQALPEGLSVNFLDMEGCTSFSQWPEAGSIVLGRLNLRDCVRATALPDWIGPLAQLDVSGCENLHALPPTLRLSAWLDLAGTRITALPKGVDGVQLRWRGVPVDARIAFEPETIDSHEVLGEENAELRRVKMERMGYERFLDDADATVRDRDADPGGERTLFHVPLEDDEDLVVLSVQCPSTGRRYIIRVPPKMKTCHQAAAWIAGFEDPDKYAPVVET
jgi:hypothetical protein